MALTPVNAAPGGTPSPSTNPFEQAMLAAIQPEAPPTETPVEETPPAPEPEVKPEPEPVKEEKPVTPIEEIKKEDDGTATKKLPVEEELEEEPEPVKTKEGKDPVSHRLEELHTQIRKDLKPKIKELEETVAQRDARLKEMEGAMQELEELRNKKAELESEVSVVRLERTEEFRKLVTEPEKVIESRARELAENYGIDEAKLFDAFVAPDEKTRRSMLKDATSGLDIDADDAFEIRKLMSDYQPILAKREELFSKADEALAELSARKERETAAQAAARAEERAKHADDIAGIIKKGMPFVGDAALEQAVKAVKETSMEALDDRELAYNHLAGRILGKVKLAYSKLQQDYDNVLSELDSYKKSTPKAVGGFTPSQSASSPKDLETALLRGLGLGG